MTDEQFDAAHRAFRRRRPFVKFSIELSSGARIAVSHPEAVENVGDLYVIRQPDRSASVFAAESVTRLHD